METERGHHALTLPTRGAPEAQGVEILVVDDTERNLAALEAMLSDLDAHVVRARSGAEALRALLRQDFALILLDVRMPGIDGFETAQLIRARDRSRSTPIIFLTAFDRTRDQEVRGYALGAVDFLSKPVIPEVLRGKIAVLIELHRKTEEVRRQAALLEETQRREHERKLEAERRRWEQEALRYQVERERQGAEALQRSNARLRLVSDAASDLLLESEPRPFAARLLSQVSDHLGLELGAWHEVQADGTLVLAARTGFDEAAAGALRRIERGEGPLGQVAATRRRLVLTEAEPSLELRGVAAGAVFPVAAGPRLHGVLTFATRTPRSLEADEVAALDLVARGVAATLERWCLVAELRQRAAELKEADARKDQFLAMLGHELRNPLAPVLNAVKLMQGRDAGDPVLQRVIGAADRQIRHMTRLLDDLLDVSRIRNGKIELKRSTVDLRQVIQDALHANECAIAERGHALELSLPDQALPVDGDPVRLAQVVANLLQNAAKYTECGGHLGLSVARRGDAIVLSVRDDGIGIEPAMLPRIFDMFVQVDQGASRAYGGLGIGLTLVRTLVEMHGGSVVARSEGLGRGSEIEVTLPALPGEAAAAPAEGEGEGQPASSGPRHRALDIVVVEDNPDIRDSLRALLMLRGHNVAEAEDGRAGIDLIRARVPGVALIDIGLPGVDGYQMARELRQTGSPTCLIAMTGYGRPEDRRLALDAGFHAHLVKPVDFDDLAKLLDELP